MGRMAFLKGSWPTISRERASNIFLSILIAFQTADPHLTTEIPVLARKVLLVIPPKNHPSRRLGSFLCLTVAITVAAWAEAPTALQIDNNAILNHLNTAISWYRHLSTADETSGQPSDVLYLQNARDLAHQALQFAFESAQAEASLRRSPSDGQDQTPNTDMSSDQQNLAKALSNTNDRITQIQSQIDALNQQLQAVRGKKRQDLTSQRDALQGELGLDKAMLEALQKISSSVNANGESKSGLEGQINQLKQSVPEVFAPASQNQNKPIQPSQPANATRADNSGLVGQISILFGQMRDLHDLDRLISETKNLRQTAEQLRTPLVEQLRALLQQGRDAVNQQANGPSPQDTRRNLEALTSRFKQISAAAVPLREEIVILDQCRAELLEWRTSILMEYGRVLRSLLTRVAGIFIALAIVFLLSHLWRSAAYRYIHDPRRRRQVLLVRRFITAFFVGLVIILGFISEFSSLATFAGFITAGLAVALQTVILSIAAYFFLVGRYGVRVGDRITVSNVTGDVIEVGLVRLYLMELSGTGIDLYPTGRVVVFANSVLFQATPLYKQLPGTSFTWHELAVALAPTSDYALVESKLLAAVNTVYDQYRKNLEHQQRLVERLIDTPVMMPTPKTQLHFTDTGLEFVVRYPVELDRAAETDDQMTRTLMDVIDREPELKAAVAGTPKLRAAIRA